jgi:hypothetical protein
MPKDSVNTRPSSPPYRWGAKNKARLFCDPARRDECIAQLSRPSEPSSATSQRLPCLTRLRSRGRVQTAAATVVASAQSVDCIRSVGEWFFNRKIDCLHARNFFPRGRIGTRAHTHDRDPAARLLLRCLPCTTTTKNLGEGISRLAAELAPRAAASVIKRAKQIA